MSQSQFICIYCLKSEPEVDRSDAHIFPAGIGGAHSSREIVCKNCNGLTNRTIENPVIEKSAFFRSVWGIKGQHGHLPRVNATVKFADIEQRVKLDDNGELTAPIVITDVDKNGMKEYRVIGFGEKGKEQAADMRQGISTTYPYVAWEEAHHTETPLTEFVIEFMELGGITLRRLAAKVAFERWAEKRASLIANDGQYAQIRDFVLTGNHDFCSGLLPEPPPLTGLNDLPVGIHAGAIVHHVKSRILGAFVVFFGLFYYWVLISTRYQSLQSDDEFWIENPQTGYFPDSKLTWRVKPISIDWDQHVHAYRKDPEGIAKKATIYSEQKFREAWKEAVRDGRTL